MLILYIEIYKEINMVSYCQKKEHSYFWFKSWEEKNNKLTLHWLYRQRQQCHFFFILEIFNFLNNAKKLIRSCFYFLIPWLLKSDFKICIHKPQMIQNSTEYFISGKGDFIISVLYNFHGFTVQLRIYFYSSFTYI